MNNKQAQKSGDNCINIQVAGDMVIQHETSIVLWSVEEMSKKLISGVFGELTEKAKKQIQDNQQSYLESLKSELRNVVESFEKLQMILDSPDFQYISKRAAISASRTPSIELHQILSKLIINRINAEGDENKRIMFNEAINKVDRVTQNQLKILVLNLLLRRSKLVFDSFNHTMLNLEKLMRPFLDCEIKLNEIRHLISVNCLVPVPGSGNLLGRFMENYQSLPDVNGNSEIIKYHIFFKEISSISELTTLLDMDLTTPGITLAAIYLNHIVEKFLGFAFEIDNWLN